MKPWLWLPPTWSHALAPAFLPLVARLASDGKPAQWKSFLWQGHHFPNPLGLAGGVDKEGNQLLQWQQLGAGFLEVGTITPRPQGPNPGRIMDRHTRTLSVWNKMGFPNPGAQAVRQQLLKYSGQLKIPLFINIGKNRDTDNHDAAKDYCQAYDILKDCGDIFVINISSPNTKGLRDLQSRQYLSQFLDEIRNYASDKKLLLKLSPDMDNDNLRESLDLAMEKKMDGFILTNTTLQRPLELPFPPHEGGVSGDPLKILARQALSTTTQHLGDQKKNYLVVSVGGILDYEEVAWRLDHGANLTQVYAALVYQGPFFFQEAAKYPWH